MAHDPHYARKSIGDGKLAELVTHLAFYAGWPCAFSATGALRRTRGELAP